VLDCVDGYKHSSFSFRIGTVIVNYDVVVCWLSVFLKDKIYFCNT
jgi:hypothetical protein